MFASNSLFYFVIFALQRRKRSWVSHLGHEISEGFHHVEHEISDGYHHILHEGEKLTLEILHGLDAETCLSAWNIVVQGLATSPTAPLSISDNYDLKVAVKNLDTN